MAGLDRFDADNGARAHKLPLHAGQRGIGIDLHRNAVGLAGLQQDVLQQDLGAEIVPRLGSEQPVGLRCQVEVARLDGHEVLVGHVARQALDQDLLREGLLGRLLRVLEGVGCIHELPGRYLGEGGLLAKQQLAHLDDVRQGNAARQVKVAGDELVGVRDELLAQDMLLQGDDVRDADSVQGILVQFRCDGIARALGQVREDEGAIGIRHDGVNAVEHHLRAFQRIAASGVHGPADDRLGTADAQVVLDHHRRLAAVHVAEGIGHLQGHLTGTEAVAAEGVGYHGEGQGLQGGAVVLRMVVDEMHRQQGYAVGVQADGHPVVADGQRGLVVHHGHFHGGHAAVAAAVLCREHDGVHAHGVDPVGGGTVGVSVDAVVGDLGVRVAVGHRGGADVQHAVAVRVRRTDRDVGRYFQHRSFLVVDIDVLHHGPQARVGGHVGVVAAPLLDLPAPLDAVARGEGGLEHLVGVVDEQVLAILAAYDGFAGHGGGNVLSAGGAAEIGGPLDADRGKVRQGQYLQAGALVAVDVLRSPNAVHRARLALVQEFRVRIGHALHLAVVGAYGYAEEVQVLDVRIAGDREVIGAADHGSQLVLHLHQHHAGVGQAHLVDGFQYHHDARADIGAGEGGMRAERLEVPRHFEMVEFAVVVAAVIEQVGGHGDDAGGGKGDVHVLLAHGGRFVVVHHRHVHRVAGDVAAGVRGGVIGRIGALGHFQEGAEAGAELPGA